MKLTNKVAIITCGAGGIGRGISLAMIKEGAKIAYENLKPLLTGVEDELDTELAANFDSLQALLDNYRVGDGFKLYTELTQEQIQELSAGVDALSEPLSNLTAAVVK